MSLPEPHVRRRLLGVLFLASGTARIAFIATGTVAPLVGDELMDSAALAGLPFAASIIGLAAGTAPIANLMARRGRRVGMATGLLLSIVGVVTATVAISAGWFILFVAAMFTFGFGSAADRLARYAAADISSVERRAFAISLVVWAGTLGALTGPVILEPAKRMAEGLGLDGLAGPPLLASMAFALSALLVFGGLRPDPLQFAGGTGRLRRERAPIGDLLRTPRVRFAVATLVAGQMVMTLIMAMTPVHMDHAGQGLGVVGLVISSHVFGMFVVSPVTGMLADRLGRLPVMLTGLGVLFTSAVMAATAGGADTPMLVASLFLLGFGWNLGYVAGSSYLTEGAGAEQRVPLEGAADTAVWGSGAAAALLSGILLELTDYAFLSLTAGALVLVPAAIYAKYGRSLSAVPARP